MALDNGIYVAFSRQAAQFRQMNYIANNIANVNTVGYKSNHMLFKDYLEPQGNGSKRDKLAFSQDYGQYLNTDAGTSQATGNQLDAMIIGDGFFVVDTPNGPRYTRAGNFQVDGTGVLVTAQGYPVMGEGGERIQFQEDDVTIEIRPEGDLVINGEERGRIQVVKFQNPNFMEKVGKNLYNTTEAPQPVELPRIAQGMIENSNVEPILEMTKMITAIRQVSATSQFIENSYDLQRKAITTLSKQQR